MVEERGRCQDGRCVDRVSRARATDKIDSHDRRPTQPHWMDDDATPKQQRHVRGMFKGRMLAGEQAVTKGRPCESDSALPAMHASGQVEGTRE